MMLRKKKPSKMKEFFVLALGAGFIANSIYSFWYRKKRLLKWPIIGTLLCWFFLFRNRRWIGKISYLSALGMSVLGMVTLASALGSVYWGYRPLFILTAVASVGFLVAFYLFSRCKQKIR